MSVLRLAFVHIDGDLYHSVLVPRLPQRVVLNRLDGPLFHVIPAYAVLVVKGSQNCEGPRAMVGDSGLRELDGYLSQGCEFLNDYL